MVLVEYKSSFVTYKLKPGIYTFKDLSETLSKCLQPESPTSNNEFDIEFDGITGKNKLVVKDSIIAIRFDEKLSFSTVIGFKYGWDNKH